MNRDKIIRIIKNAVAIVVILAMLVIIFYQNRDRDIFKFGKDGNSSVVSSDNSQHSTESYSKSDAKRVGGSVAFVTPSTFSVLNTNAKGSQFSIAISNPILQTHGDYSVIYEIGGMQAFVYKGSKLCYSISAQDKIIKAKVNSNGYLLLSVEKAGYNCESTVYNRNGEAIFRWNISKSEFLDGMVNSSNNAILLSVATAKEDKLCGEILLIDIRNAEIIKRHTMESQLFYEVCSLENDNYAAYGNSSLIYMNSDGSQKWSYNYEEQMLLKADISNPDMLVLAFEPEGNILQGSSTEVVVMNRLGQITGKKTYDSSIVDLAISDSAIAMVYGKTVIIADGKLKEKKKIKSDTTIEKIALYSDNKHVFVIGTSDSKILR